MNELKLRPYQKEVLEIAERKNTLVVLPTGLGKTFIALALTKKLLNSGRVLFLAPTKPLCVQHKKTFSEFGLDGVVITGEISKNKRRWYHKIIFCTPQTLRNDLMSNKVDLSDVSLIIFDEAHRAVGDYAYVEIAKRYINLNPNGRILALTASPGDNRKTIKEICNNLNIKEIKYKTEQDEDILPYVKEKEWERREVKLSERIQNIVNLINSSIESYILELNKLGYNLNYKKLSKKQLLEIQKKLSSSLKYSKNFILYKSASLVATIIKLQYCLELIQSQSLGAFVRYFDDLKSQNLKASKRICEDSNIIKAYNLSKTLLLFGEEHPKFYEIRRIIESNIDKKVMIFTNYVYTAKLLSDYLSKIGIKTTVFIGQRKGLTQKKQIEIIDKFRQGLFNVLVSTSIGEEGLHIPSVDLGIFFEPVPSALRMIQRRGRVGRTTFGKIIVLYTKDGIDEKYYWVAKHKQRKMYNAINFLSKRLNDENNS